MSFNWQEFLLLADGLSQQPDLFSSEEAGYRTAISRAYYAAFCAARNFARGRGEIMVSGYGEDHERVIRHFQRSGDKEGRKVADLLRALRTKRNAADYEDSLTAPHADAHIAVMEAGQVFKALGKIK